jgi:DNA-binding GntR family transcriptional regulator
VSTPHHIRLANELRARINDQDGRPLEFGIDRYRGEAFAMVVHSSR